MQQLQAQQDPNTMPPYVTFEKRSIEDRSKELEAGVYGFRDVNIAKITRPGQRDTVERPAEEWLADLARKTRENAVPANWLPAFQASFEAWKRGEEIPLNGTPILGWSLAVPAQQKTIAQTGIRTVEELASASDEALQRLGMGAISLKQKAQAWLAEGQSKGAAVARLVSVEQENAALKEKLDTLLKEMAGLKAQVEAASAKKG